MLSKDALKIVLSLGPGFYSHLFLVEKVTSRDRPLSPERVCFANSIQDGDSCLHASVHPTGGFPSFHRSEGRVFPDTRSSVIEEAIEVPVRRDSLSVQGPMLRTVDCPSGLHSGVCSGICMGSLPRDSFPQVRYLDDWLVLASSEMEAKKNVQDLLSLCLSLGIVINEKKSDLVPSQTANYLGMTIDTGAARIFPSLAWVEKFLSVAETFCTLSAPPAQLWQVVLGHLASLERLVPHSQLQMRSLQWHLKTHWSPE